MQKLEKAEKIQNQQVKKKKKEITGFRESRTFRLTTNIIQFEEVNLIDYLSQL